MNDIKNDKFECVLGIYTKPMNGLLINKAEEAKTFEVNERSTQRDINDIRSFLELEVENTECINSMIYDSFDKGYRWEQIYKLKLT